MPNISYTNDASGYTLNTPMPSFGGVTGSGLGIDFSGLNSFYQQMAARKAQEEARRREEEARRQAFQEKMQASGFNMNAEEHRAKMQAMQEDRARQNQMLGRELSKESAGPGQSMMMDTRTGRWSNWTDPQEAERFNTGKVLAGRVAMGPGQKDDWNVSSLQYGLGGLPSSPGAEREREDPGNPFEALSLAAASQRSNAEIAERERRRREGQEV